MPVGGDSCFWCPGSEYKDPVSTGSALMGGRAWRKLSGGLSLAMKCDGCGEHTPWVETALRLWLKYSFSCSNAITNSKTAVTFTKQKYMSLSYNRIGAAAPSYRNPGPFYLITLASWDLALFSGLRCLTTRAAFQPVGRVMGKRRACPFP